MTELELKLANLILNDFSEIEGKSSAGGARANKLATLIKANGKTVFPYVDNKIETSTNRAKIKKLSELKVKGFRGFHEYQNFDLSRDFTFIYGPNGSGKSSFCEALEYSLTGKINEATSKRFESSQYIINKLAPSIEVSLTVEYDDGNVAVARKDSLENEFIFIERNRIEAFARVSSYTPQGQQQRLSALFGLEEFNNFCSGFNKSIDKKFPLAPTKEMDLKNKEREVEKSKLIVESKTKELERYGKRRDSILSKYPDNSLVSEVLELLSSAPNGLIHKKKNEIEKLSKIKLKPIENIDKFLVELASINEQVVSCTKLSDEINKYRNELNFIDLYSAIKKLSVNSLDSCPACDTPLLSVINNPFSKADDQLRILEEISSKQKALKKQTQNLSNQLIRFSSELKVVEITISITIDNFNETSYSIKSRLEKLRNEWKKYNAENKEATDRIESFKKDLDLLEKDHVECSTISELYKVGIEEKSNSEKVIDDFNSKNKELIANVELEKLEILHYKQYSGAYESLIGKLKQYSDTLPLKLAKSLDNKVIDIYNAINKHPYEHEVLKSLTLPTKPNEGIKIRYIAGDTEDALRVFSEGHLRCLGLSILLAKNIHDGHNIIIFDDVVNAIDDEHRAGIINELFSNELLLVKQIILTTHGEDFIKRLENQLPSKELKKRLKRYDFIRNYDGRDILIEQNMNRHYLVKAEQCFKKGQVKDCLMECRRSLEELSIRLWNKLKTEGLDPALSVKLRAPASSPDLYNLLNGLAKYIGDIEIKPGIKNFSKHRICLMKIKDVSQKNPITWNLLNKGTHEEDRDEEFDENQAKELFELCRELEDLVKNSIFQY